MEVHSSPFRGSLLCIRRSANCQHYSIIEVSVCTSRIYRHSSSRQCSAYCHFLAIAACAKTVRWAARHYLVLNRRHRGGAAVQQQ